MKHTCHTGLRVESYLAACSIPASGGVRTTNPIFVVTTMSIDTSVVANVTLGPAIRIAFVTALLPSGWSLAIAAIKNDWGGRGGSAHVMRPLQLLDGARAARHEVTRLVRVLVHGCAIESLLDRQGVCGDGGESDHDRCAKRHCRLSEWSGGDEA